MSFFFRVYAVFAEFHHGKQQSTETVALLGLKGLLVIVFNLNKDENVFVF